MMTAIAISEPGGPRVLKPETRDVPQPGPGEILIRVHAAGVNRPDVQQRKGAYPPPPGASDLPGLEVSGEVAALGDEISRWRIGDRVCALTPGGGYAEYVKVHAGSVLPLPAGYHPHGSGGGARELFHRLAQCVRARRPEDGRDRCWSMAARPASAPRRSSWRRRSAPM